MNDGHNERAWSAPPQPGSRQRTMPGDPPDQQAHMAAPHHMAWPVMQEAEDRLQASAVPSAVQQRAAQYAGDEGLARPPTRPPSDWRSRQHQPQGDESLATVNDQSQPSQTYER